jgi:hypothetical protein
VHEPHQGEHRWADRDNED